MSIEVHPIGVACNLSCPYCYQLPMRDVGGNAKPGYDMEAMKEALLQEGGRFTIFGGEPLLMPFDDLEELCRFGHEHFGGSSIQSNGTLIEERHLDLFERWKVHAGISADGPPELNRSRWAGSDRKTLTMSKRTTENLKKLLARGISTSLIVTLHRGNATEEKLPVLIAWFHELVACGLRDARLHTLEVDHDAVGEAYALTDEENLAAFGALAALERHGLRFDIFTDLAKVLMAGKDATCVWNACDPWTTSAVRGVDADGTRLNCGRTNKDGINWVKAGQSGFERQLALYHTPQEDGGCQGCKFFFACKGQCPGTGLDGDWRNRSDGCRTWYGLLETAEASLLEAGKEPLSADEERRDEVHRVLIEAWSQGINLGLQAAATWPKGEPVEGRDGWHSDSPHGDEHGDSWHGDAHADSDSNRRYFTVVEVKG
jgi:uncharacterized protein